jgi:hypothetical protein
VSTDPFQPPGANPGGPGLLQQPPPPPPGGGQVRTADLYSESVDLNQALTAEQREAFKQNLLTPGVPVWAFVTLSIITFGIFPTIYLQLKQSKLPVVKADDPRAGKAIGFMLIPFFNIYWYFVVWPRLVDRINFQYRLRGRPSPVNRGQVTTAQVLSLVGWIVIGVLGLAGAIWLLVLGAQLQSASNELAEDRI